MRSSAIAAPILDTILLGHRVRIVKDLRSKLKANSVLAPVALRFGLAPLKQNNACQYYNGVL